MTSTVYSSHIIDYRGPFFLIPWSSRILPNSEGLLNAISAVQFLLIHIRSSSRLFWYPHENKRRPEGIDGNGAKSGVS